MRIDCPTVINIAWWRTKLADHLVAPYEGVGVEKVTRQNKNQEVGKALKKLAAEIFRPPVVPLAGGHKVGVANSPTVINIAWRRTKFADHLVAPYEGVEKVTRQNKNQEVGKALKKLAAEIFSPPVVPLAGERKVGVANSPTVVNVAWRRTKLADHLVAPYEGVGVEK